MKDNHAVPLKGGQIQIEVQVLIPYSSNDGRVFGQEHHAAFEAFVSERFTGLSQLPGDVDGVWKAHHDTNRIYIISIPSILEGGLLRDVLDFAKVHYMQEAVYIRYLGLSEVY
jgi:hypothetical protein